MLVRLYSSYVCVCVRLWFVFCFFFQAVDGIRDYKVTGVQTCALPISEAGWRKSPPAGSWITFQRHVRYGIPTASISTRRSRAKEALMLLRWRQGPRSSEQTEISGRPWLTLTCQSEGKCPGSQPAVFKTMKANGAVRAWRISTRMALKRDNFFKNPLGGLASSSKYYYRINGPVSPQTEPDSGPRFRSECPR